MTNPRAVSAVADDEHELRRPPGGGVLVFDGYCGFCTRAVHILLRIDRRRRIRALPAQGPRVLALAGITRDEAMREVWWIAADGTRSGGAGAAGAAISAATGVPVGALYRIRLMRATADRAYRWVAEHRRLLGGVTPHCEAHPEARCDPDSRAL